MQYLLSFRVGQSTANLAEPVKGEGETNREGPHHVILKPFISTYLVIQPSLEVTE